MTRYQQFLSLVTDRYSCRSYSPQVPSREILSQVLEAVRLAPSACNRQPWHFIVVTDAHTAESVRRCYGRDWINTAPAFIIAVGDHNEAWHRASYDNKDHTDVDLSIAIEHLCLAAASLGLGTCWICNFDAALLKSSFSLPETSEPIAIIPIGYPSEDSNPTSKVRKSLEDITEWI